MVDFRVCIDYLEINRRTIPDHSSILRINCRSLLKVDFHNLEPDERIPPNYNVRRSTNKTFFFNIKGCHLG